MLWWQATVENYNILHFSGNKTIAQNFCVSWFYVWFYPQPVLVGSKIQELKDDRITKLGTIHGVGVHDNYLWLGHSDGLTRFKIRPAQWVSNKSHRVSTRTNTRSAIDDKNNVRSNSFVHGFCADFKKFAESINSLNTNLKSTKQWLILKTVQEFTAHVRFWLSHWYWMPIVHFLLVFMS